MIDETKQTAIDHFLIGHGFKKSDSVNHNLIYHKNCLHTDESKMIYIEPTRNTFRLITICSVGIIDKLIITDTTEYTCRQLLKRIIPYL